MREYYYSKFDNVNWTWWDAQQIPPDDKDLLDGINLQLKIYRPGKFLFFLAAEHDFVLVSERTQAGWDSGGRSFSFRHFMLVNKREVDDYDSFLKMFSRFREPANLQRPDLADGTLPAMAIHGESIYFDMIWDAFLHEKRLCIVNEAINEKADTTKQAIDRLAFANFPEVYPFLCSMAILPPLFIRKLSFCLNYEDGLINTSLSRLTDIQLVYCGMHTIVEEGFSLDHAIGMQELKSQNFDITEVAHLDLGESKWSRVYRFLKNPDGKEDVLQLLNAWAATHAAASIYEAARFCTEAIDKVADKNSALDEQFLTTVLNLPSLSAQLKNRLVKQFLSHQPEEDTWRIILDYIHLPGIVVGDIISHAESVKSLRSIPVESFIGLLADKRLHRLPLSVQEHFKKAFRSLGFTWEDLKKRAIFEQVQEEVKATADAMDLIRASLRQNRYKEVSKEDLQVLYFLYPMPKFQKEYEVLLQEVFNRTGDTDWLKEAGRIGGVLTLENIRIQSGDAVCHWLKIAKEQEAAIHKKSVSYIYAAVEDYLPSYTPSLHMIMQINESLAGGRKDGSAKKSINQWLVQQLAKLLAKFFNSPTEDFENGRKDTSLMAHENRELLDDAIEYLFKDPPGLITNQWLFNVLTIFDQMNLSDRYVLGYLKQLNTLSRYHAGSPSSQSRKLDGAILSLLEKNKLAEKIPQEFLTLFQHPFNPLGGIWHFIMSQNRFLLLTIGVLLLTIPIGIHHLKNSNPAATTTQAQTGVQEESRPPAEKPVVKVDPDALMADSAQTILQGWLFPERDTLGYKGFRKRLKKYPISMSFDAANFTSYRIKQVDTVKGYPTWNAFVRHYNNHTDRFGIRLVPLLQGNDSISRVIDIQLFIKQ